jgi:hypothetical protein
MNEPDSSAAALENEAMGEESERTRGRREREENRAVLPES